MSALLELIKETPPEDLKEIALELKPYMHIEVNRPDPDQLLTVPQFKQELSKLGIVKRLDWIRNDMFVQLPELKDYVFNRNAGPGHHMKISRKAIDVIKQHRDEIDWRG